MKRLLAIIFAFVATTTMAQDPYWENPEMFAENKLPARATLVPYLTEDEQRCDAVAQAGASADRRE